MKISEIFESIQGEGTNAGKPAVFLRTAECNLKCTWCDTKYTWDWKNFDYAKEVKEISVAVDEFSKLQTTQHTEMTYHFNDITKINEALKNLD